MIVFGLSGGIASGKSTVAGLLAERGAVVLDADRHAHAVLAEPEVRDAVVARWGEGVLAEDGSLRRGAIAERVFGGSAEAIAERRFLEGLIHPRVRERLHAALAEAAVSGAEVAVLDIPLLHEAGWADTCDAVLHVDAPEGVRLQRAAERGWSAEEFAHREAAQMPIEEKSRLADFIVPGDSLDGAKAAIAEAWGRWVDPDPSPRGGA